MNGTDAASVADTFDALCATDGCIPKPKPVDVVFKASTGPLLNPERGWYRHKASHSHAIKPLTVSELAQVRVQHAMSLIYRIWYLQKWRESALPKSQLDAIIKDFAAMRTAGIKAIVRFAYTKESITNPTGWPPKPPYGDATKPVILQHIAQLAPLFKANADVIVAVQAGFIGIWGEWYYTTHFGDPLKGPYTAANWKDRGDVVDALLAAVPHPLTIQLRTPLYKTTLVGSTTPVAAKACLGKSKVARLSHHNDCFLASATDFGTWANAAKQYPYVAADTRCVPIGGETCNVNAPRTDCKTAMAELAKFHYTFLNSQYHPKVLAAWQTQGCTKTITNRLGYRLRLVSAALPSAHRPGDTMRLVLKLQNDGYAAPVLPRNLRLFLRNTVTGKLWRATLPADLRTMVPDAIGKGQLSINTTVALPASMHLGKYDMLVRLEDPAPKLAGRPEFAIRLANSGYLDDNGALQPMWDAKTGMHKVGAMTVSQFSPPSTEKAATTLVAVP